MARTIAFEDIRDDYTRLLGVAKIKESWLGGFQRIADRARSYRHRYEDISERLGGRIPWQFIAAIHNLESGMNFHKHLHNGDSLNARTKRVPRGRPKTGNPPFTWEESAVDALKMKGLDKIENWSWERMCYELERYNGFGYRLYHPDTLSPYLWSGTNLYHRGKYVADGKWSSSAVSKQAGAIGILKLLMVDEFIDKSAKHTITDTASKTILTVGGGGLMSWTTMDKVREFTTDHAGILLLLVGAIFFVTFKYLEERQKRDAKEGRYIPSGMVERDA